MNKKTILNRTLPLIIALGVVLIIAICVTAFSGQKKTPMVENKTEEYLSIELEGYEDSVLVSKEEVYNKLKHGDNGVTFLLNKLDYALLEKLGYTQKYQSLTDEVKEKIRKAIEEEIFGEDYEFEDENFDSDVEKIEKYIDRLFISFGIEVAEGSIEIENHALSVDVTNQSELVKYYILSFAKEDYTREQMIKDQKEAYEEYVKAFEEYLVELYKYENELDNVTTAPTAPTDGSIITEGSVEADYNAENTDSYWTLFVSYATREEAEQALLQAGVVIYNNEWYEYQGYIDLKAENEKLEKDYKTLASYYAGEVEKFGPYQIQLKLIELYNNAKNPNTEAFLVEGTHYTLSTITKAEYDALTAAEKIKYEEFPGATEEAEPTYKTVLFNTTVVKDAEGNVDEENKANALYYTNEKLSNFDSSVLSYIKSLTALYHEDAKSWNSCFSKTVQAKGSYYVIALKLFTDTAVKFEDNENFGNFYDAEKYEEGIEESKLSELQLGYVPYTRNEDGELTFTYSEDNVYWNKVLELLEESINSTKINTYMAELRVEKGLIIYDEKIEAKYMETNTSEYEATKKANSSIVAKLSWKDDNGDKQEIVITAEELYNELDKAFGAITAADTYQYHNVLSQNEIIDYNKYLAGAKLANCVIITDYALAKEGSTDPVTKWVKDAKNVAEQDGIVTFSKVDTSINYDVLVRKTVAGKVQSIEKFDYVSLEFEDPNASKSTATVVISDEVDFQDAEGKFASFDESIEALKLYFSNGNFTDYGYDPSYGWKNFLRDYFLTYYGITVNSNEDLKVYYIYEDTIANITEKLAETNDEYWNNYYLPYMQQAYDTFFSVDAIHFLIFVEDEEGNMLDPLENTWSEAQVKAAQELYDKVLQILNKTKKSSQGNVLQQIVDAFDAAPKFVANVAQTTEAQQQHFQSDLYKDEVGESVIELTAEFKQVVINVSEYKTLGLQVKYEDLGTVTAGQMVENFENALKLMWNKENNSDQGMQEGTALETNTFYTPTEYAGAEQYLATEFGYHVLVANKFTGRATAKDSEKVVKTISVPTRHQVDLYEAGGEDETGELMEVEKANVENYFKPISEDFAKSYWYQINVMKQLVETVNDPNSNLTFVNADKKAQLIKIAEYYIENYYLSLTYISEGYDYVMDLMEIFTEAYNGYVNGNNNVTVETLEVLVKVASDQLTAFDATTLNGTETKEFNEVKAAFEEAKAAFNK